MNLPIKLGQIRKCLNCETEFRTGRKHTGIKYCSRSCWRIHWKGKNTHMWGRLGEKSWNFGKKLSEEHKKKISKSRKGKNVGIQNHKWVVDRTLLTKKQERNDSAYKEWRKNVWIRDNFKCKIKNFDCGGRIESHHILSWIKFPELRYEVNNGITLCHFHHPFKEEDEKKLFPFFQEIVRVKLQ